MEYVFLGTPYPILQTPRGYLPTISGLNTIKADLLQLLLTYPGERVMLPTFGTPLKDLIFEPNDNALRDKARTMVINSIKKWEPRIAVDAVEVTSGSGLTLSEYDDNSETEKILGIKILFKDPQNITRVDELVLEVPL